MRKVTTATEETGPSEEGPVYDAPKGPCLPGPEDIPARSACVFNFSMSLPTLSIFCAINSSQPPGREGICQWC